MANYDKDLIQIHANALQRIYNAFIDLDDIGKLVEAIHQTIHYYNNERIHTTLKMPPSAFAKLHKSV